MKKGISFLWFSFLSFYLYGQDNCLQFPAKPVYLINNPSFEIDPTNCTSGYFGQQGLTIPYWTTPSNEILTGYLNACTNFQIAPYLINDESATNTYMYLFPIVPQPIPDGNGVAVVADFGYNGAPNTYPFHKSYVSTCLTDVLQKDSLYRLDFFVGFGKKTEDVVVVHNAVLAPSGSLGSEKFTLFGYTDCNNNGIPIIGCPAISGWTVLGSCEVSGGVGKWVQASIKFKAPPDIHAISLGPSCDTNLVLDPSKVNYNGQNISANKYSFFLDALQFYKSSVPVPQIQIISGSPCSDAFNLQLKTTAFNAGYNIQWYKNGAVLTNENSTTLTINRNNYGSGFFYCRIGNDSTCLSSDTLSVRLDPIPNSSFLGEPDTVACLGDTVLLNSSADTSFNYIWQDGSTLPVLSATENGNYSVTISNACGTAQAQKKVSFEKCILDIFLSNAFTPNGDGKNDFFKVNYSVQPLKFKMNVYTRYGQLIFSSSDPSAQWDGSFKNRPQPAGTYVYEVEFTDRKNKHHLLKGTMQLIR